MKIEKLIFRQSYLFFGVFALLVLTGFWLTYITRISQQENYRMHLHGFCLFAWCAMLIAQPLLIRRKKNAWHRRLGTVSYVLVPAIFFTTTDLLHYRLQKAPQLANGQYHFAALVFFSLLAFAVFYGMAIYQRKHAAIHARYMICTVFPFLTPATDRIIHIHIPALLHYAPQIDGQPLAPVFGFALADMVLILLSVADLRAKKRRYIFPFALALLLVMQYGILHAHEYAWWQRFVQWFAQ